MRRSREPEADTLRTAFHLARLDRLFPTPMTALEHETFGIVLRAAYKHVIRSRRRRRSA